ncbi:hypothetical protein QVD99_000789 [Batrachochytrium dendrobatidis]|uniref:Mid2 domain-containing protein n=1 Tax=Batrachochytrium dendrobatidis (strain JEL423) TaxID=403673 RepID=A0A177WJE7_BATDL|nr:hypothetical protein O5D80_003638 [Batrachochytrium dendrobatidis]KAK5673338.1 hypothetical protein QVD99_000789 [Batrachochytrium dendrobatidis]OAJ39784.1 hypothetical protein BDEG_23607 [Batrachochytrium dendrobatidis JEL423]
MVGTATTQRIRATGSRGRATAGSSRCFGKQPWTYTVYTILLLVACSLMLVDASIGKTANGITDIQHHLQRRAPPRFHLIQKRQVTGEVSVGNDRPPSNPAGRNAPAGSGANDNQSGSNTNDNRSGSSSSSSGNQPGSGISVPNPDTSGSTTSRPAGGNFPIAAVPLPSVPSAPSTPATLRPSILPTLPTSVSPIISVTVTQIVTSQRPSTIAEPAAPSPILVSEPSPNSDTNARPTRDPTAAAASSTAATSNKGSNSAGTNVAIIGGVLGGAVVFGILGIYIFRKTNLQPSKSFKQRINPNYRNSLAFPSFGRQEIGSGSPHNDPHSPDMTEPSHAHDPQYHNHGTLTSNYSGYSNSGGYTNTPLAGAAAYQSPASSYGGPQTQMSSAGYGNANVAHHPAAAGAQHYPPSNSGYYSNALHSAPPPSQSHYPNGY